MRFGFSFKIELDAYLRFDRQLNQLVFLPLVGRNVHHFMNCDHHMVLQLSSAIILITIPENQVEL